MKKIRRHNVSEAVYSAMKQVVLNNKYSPGERIGIEELCQQLEVSRTPVFEALNRLKTEGMVEIIPRKGVYLVSFSVEKAQEVYIVREALEGMATKLAAEKLTPRYANLLKASLDEQAACLQEEDIKGYATATIDFHNIVLKAADNDTLSRNLGAIYAQIEALRLRRLYLPRRLRASYAEHQRIYQALIERNLNSSEREARKHVESAIAEVLNILAEKPEAVET